MTDAERIAQIAERAKQASTGPWYVEAERDKYGHRIYDQNSFGVCKPTRGSDAHDRANADFIAASREDVSWLLAQLAIRTQERDAYRVACVQMHDGLVGKLNAGMIRHDLIEDGVRLFDEAEALCGIGPPDDLLYIRSYKTLLEAAEAEHTALRQQIETLQQTLESMQIDVEHWHDAFYALIAENDRQRKLNNR